MKPRGQVLRFQEGVRLQHPPPEAVLESAPPETAAAAGAQLAVLVDLSPPLPHRSREIRVIAAEAYWASSGSVVARLRRALAHANRYLARANAQSGPGQRAAGHITCVAFFDEELFLGQVGPAHALLYHPEGDLEYFPQEDEPLLPLGATLPPIIHIGYAEAVPGSTLLLSSSDIAGTIERSRWAALLSKTPPEQVVKELESLMEARGQSGSCVLVQYLLREGEEAVAPPPRRPLLRARRRSETSPVSSPVTAKKEPQSAVGENEAPWPSAPSQPSRPRLRLPRWRLPRLRLPQLRLPTFKREKQRRLSRRWRLPHIDLQAWIRPFLPGRVKGASAPRRRRVPEENSSVMAGLTLGFLLLVLLITVTTYFQPREEVLRQQAAEAWETALETQDVDDWERLARISDQILALDPQDAEAQTWRDTAREAVASAEDATILNATPIMELGTSPAPRHLVVAQSWVYVLNPATDEVRGLPLQEDGVLPASGASTPILKGGQSVHGEPGTVGTLVDIAWMEAGPGYPDGALFIYSEDGYLYIYEPHIGPGSIDRQKLKGDLQPGAITLIETYGGQFYALDRRANQVWKYVPVNGVYADAPLAYFSSEMAPQLQNALAMALDGRLYLLLGDGMIRTYFRGTEDVSFRLDGVPLADFHPTVMAMGADVNNGLIYLGDPKQGALVALNKRGQYRRQFRLPDETLAQLEALTVGEEPHVLYFVAANRLHAAPLPASESP